MLVRTETEDSTPVLALAFDTDEAPYVIRPGSGSVDFEIPWRAGTRTRSAKRSEVLRLLVPSSLVPDVQPLKFELDIHVKEDRTELRLVGRIMFLPRSTDLVFLPAHTVDAKLVWFSGKAPAFNWEMPASELTWGEFVQPRSLSARMPGTEPKFEAPFCWAQQDGIYIAGPGSVPIRYFTPSFATDVKPEALTGAELWMRIPVASTDLGVHLQAMMILRVVAAADAKPGQFHFELTS